MTADRAPLAAPLVDGDVRLEPLVEADREALRYACAADRDIWDIYPISFLDDAFDRNMTTILADPARTMVAIRHGDALVGMSGFLNIAPQHRRLEIGSSYIMPAVRGTGLNTRVKRLMIDRAFGCGFARIEFKVDARNARSLAAVAKLGAVREGQLRRDRVTWTGHVRDTALFSILRDEWPPAR
ncbi:GNAT family protein [uncultured Sphingomonas sp.]|uniref:GNAT family N-acetyltransferase n=1 Tax=uncultured Sphingomonas sp. TaxID=158754 RepID=UPI002627E88C|nr:GNAT family protein [uncultured Sphingomonas sp.]